MTRLPKLLCLLLASASLNAMAAEAGKPAAAVKAGTTIVSEDEAAIGLYLTPWKDEDQRPAARSPARYTRTPTPADRASDQVRSSALDNIDSYERNRRQSLSY